MTSPIAERGNNSMKASKEPSHSTSSVSQDINSDADLWPRPWSVHLHEGSIYVVLDANGNVVLNGGKTLMDFIVSAVNTRAHTPVGDAQQAREAINAFMNEVPEDSDDYSCKVCELNCYLCPHLYARLEKHFVTALQAAAASAREAEREAAIAIIGQSLDPQQAVADIRLRASLQSVTKVAAIAADPQSTEVQEKQNHG